MKINELEQVIGTIRYYGVSKSIDDVPTYLANLTQKEIANILSMEYSNKIKIAKTGEVFDYSSVFNNHKLLSSSDFKKILGLLLVKFPTLFTGKYNSEIYAETIVCSRISFKTFCEILSNDKAWEHNTTCGANLASNIEYILNKIENDKKEFVDGHLSNSNLIDKAKIIDFMRILSTNETSLKKGSHNYAMEKLQNINDLDKAKAIFDIQCSEKVPDAKVCGKYLDYIEQAQSKQIISCIKTLMLSTEICDEEIKMILNAKSAELADVLYLVADRVLYSDEMEKYLDTYLDDMRLISKVKDIDTAKALADVATSLDSISKGKDRHNAHMQTIYNSNDPYKAKTYANVILDKKGSYDEFDEILYNARRFVDSCGEEKELPAHVFSLRKKDDK